MHSIKDDIFHAIRSGDQKHLDALLPKAVDVAKFRDSDGWSPIHVAVMRDQNRKMIETLIEAGCDVNAQDKNGMTALRWACDYDKWGAIDILLDKKARVDIRDHAGELPRIPTAVLIQRLGINLDGTGGSVTRHR